MRRFVKFFRSTVLLLILSLIIGIAISAYFRYSILDFKPVKYLSGLINGIRENLIYYNNLADSDNAATGVKRDKTALDFAETVDNILRVLSTGKDGNDKTNNKDIEKQVQNSADENLTAMNSTSKESTAKSIVTKNALANDMNIAGMDKQTDMVQDPNTNINNSNNASYNMSNNMGAEKPGESEEIEDKINKAFNGSDKNNTLDDIYDYYMNFYNLISINGVSFKDKLAGFAIASKIKTSDIEKIANLVSDGITDDEIDEISVILRRNLTDNDIKVLEDILYRNIDIVAEGFM